MADTDPGWMTIENLSLRSGVTTRNIRAYQSLGLLPPPAGRPGVRAAFYTQEHLARLRLINRLQERGFALAGISELLAAWAAGRSIEQVLGIESAIVESAEDESRSVSERELRALLPAGIDRDEAVKKLLAVGLVDRQARRYRIRYPRVFELGVAAINAGIPQDALLDELVRLRSDLHGVALRFVALFAEHTLQPFLDAGSPKQQLPGIVERMKQLRQLAVAVTDALMREALADVSGEMMSTPQGGAH